VSDAEWTMDIDLTELVVLAVVIVISVAGLFLATTGGAMYGLGLAVFVVGVIVAFWLVKRYYDRIDAGRH
jgi:membrane protein implicated in regulation of membrane protease activity